MYKYAPSILCLFCHICLASLSSRSKKHSCAGRMLQCHTHVSACGSAALSKLPCPTEPQFLRLQMEKSWIS